VPTATDRTTEPTALRVTLSTGAATGTVPVGPSASENADGAGSLPTTGAISRHARVTENVRYDSEVTAVSHQRTRTPSTRDSGTPHPQAIAAAMRKARTNTVVRTTLPDGRDALRFQATDVFGWYSLPWAIRVAGEWLYRLYAADGELLYIGISGTLGSRLDHHRSKKPWWPQVDHAIATFVGPRRTALVMERDAIRSEMPAHNIACKPGARPGAVA
jgi:hypothetical protein